MAKARMAVAALWCMAVAAAGGQPEIFSFTDSLGAIDALPAALLRGAQEAYTVNMKGLDALERDNLDSAALCFSKAMSLLPNYTDARNNMGVVHFRRGNITQAGMLWKAITESDPTYSIAYYNLGVIEFHKKNYQACCLEMQKAVSLNKKFVEAFLMLGRAELMLDKPKDALEHFKAANRAAPERSETWQFLSYAYVHAGDTAAALSFLTKHQDNAAALKMLGEIEASRKNYKAASGYFSDAVSKGGNADQLLDLASSQIDGGNCKEALATLKLYASKVSVQAADAYLFSGIAAKDCGDITGAKAYFEKGIAQYPNDAILRYNLGQIYFHLKQFDQAEAMWNAVSDSLNDPSLYYLRALNARRRGNLDLAETYVRNALRRDERAEYLDLLGIILYTKGKKDEAAESFKKALRLDPELRSAQLNLALITQSKDELEKAAIETEKKRAECRSKCQDISLELAILYYHQGLLDKAANLLETLPDGEKSERIFRHLALFYRDLHEWDKAIKTLEKAKTFFVLDAQTEYELAEDYLFSGNNQKAIEALTNLIAKWDQNPWRIFYQLGYAYMELKEFEKAKNYLQQSLKKKPDNLAAQGLMAYILNAEGDVAQARSLWEKTLKEDPNNFTLMINMGLSLEKDGKYDEALQYYQKAQMLKTGDNALQINIGNVYSGMEKNHEASQAYAIALNSSKRNLAAYDLFLLAQKTASETQMQEMLAILNNEFSGSDYTKRAQAEMLLWKKDTVQALAKLEALPSKDPGDWITLAKVYTARKNFAKASQCLDKLPQDPYWEKARTGVKAQMDFFSGNYAGALLGWKSLGDSGFPVQYNMAVAAFNAKEYNEAIVIGEKIVAKARGDDRADVCRLVGNAAMGLKQWKKALQWYQQLEDVKRGDPLVEYNLAVISYNLGSMEESWTYYQKARQLDPKLENKDIEKRYQSIHPESGAAAQVMDSTDLWYNAAITLQDSGKDTAAEAAYKKILDKNPAYYHAWNNLGAIYSGRGELQQAVDCYLKSIEKQHDIPEAYANLVNVYVAMENFKEAQRWIVKGRGHNPDSQILKDLEVKVKELAKKKK
ncbi:MAG TPA: tetratricopeptide repeat protein [Chitinivibrionales bacterium]|nr:tetratricopeptide repeat protein [Chitinivibrionales bacterium]